MLDSPTGRLPASAGQVAVVLARAVIVASGAYMSGSRGCHQGRQTIKSSQRLASAMRSDCCNDQLPPQINLRGSRKRVIPPRPRRHGMACTPTIDRGCAGVVTRNKWRFTAQGRNRDDKWRRVRITAGCWNATEGARDVESWVPRARFEPARARSSQPPEDCVSTSFTTSARPVAEAGFEPAAKGL